MEERCKTANEKAMRSELEVMENRNEHYHVLPPAETSGPMEETFIFPPSKERMVISMGNKKTKNDDNMLTDKSNDKGADSNAISKRRHAAYTII